MRPRRALQPFEQEYLASVERDLSDRAPDYVRRAAVSYARNLIENDYPVIFDMAHLACVLDIKEHQLRYMASRSEEFYSSFRLQKRRGGSRLIEAPHHELKKVQHWLQHAITRKLTVHEAAHGFREGRSIVTNAAHHVGRSLVVKYDIKDFFGSVEKVAVFRSFRRVGYTRQVAHSLTGLTTLSGALPQGAPTSPDLANVAAYRLDARLSGLASRHEAIYTRYADDLTFSGSGVANPRFRRSVEYILRSSGFSPNERKTVFLRPSDQQRVTGVVVNDRAGWPRPTRRWLRQEVYYLAKYGFEEHVRRRSYQRAAYKDFLYGHLYALRQLHPVEADQALATLATVWWPY
jgi:RNA-directed DNA polymerase